MLSWVHFNISADDDDDNDDENNIDTSVRYRDFVLLINLKTSCILILLYSVKKIVKSFPTTFKLRCI